LHSFWSSAKCRWEKQKTMLDIMGELKRTIQTIRLTYPNEVHHSGTT
jgi:hypothetical protein